jgi:excisionase family DNA binding protein
VSAYANPMPEALEQPGSLVPLPSTRRNTLTRDEVMTAREVSDLLKMPVSTVYELARRGEIPARRLGRTWRFLRPRLEELLAA